MNRSTSRLFWLLFFFGLALPSTAGEGRTPVWQPITIGPGQEGTYILTRDLTAPAGGPAIDVLFGTATVDIDLNGFTIYGSAGFDLIRAVNVDSLTVRNGTLAGGGGDGIHVENARKVVVEDLKIQDVAGRGIALLDAFNFAVRRNIVHGAVAGEGILIDGNFYLGSIPDRGSIEDNIVEGCSGGVTVLNGESVGIRDNRIHGTTSGDGLYIEICSACLVVDNTVEKAAGDGMDLDLFRRGSLRGNVVASSQGGNGIALDAGSDNNLIVNNTLMVNANHGLLIDSGRNLVERNVMNNNGSGGSGYGLILNGWQNVYRGNLATGNPGPAAACAGVPATNDFCDATAGNNSPFNQPAAGLAGDNLMPGLL